VCKIKKWSNIDKNPIGTILEIIGTCGEFENESLVCLKRAHIKNVTDEVPKDVDKHLKGLIEDMGKGNIPDYVPRIDLSKELIFTIDPEHSRDLDDALSITWIESLNK
jgi:protein SSD1